MKFDNTTESSVEIVGEIQENKVGINAGDLEHIIRILSSNLYSDPIGSTVREIVSNAWDSHIEANNPDPVLITFIRTLDTTFQITFQDFGVGLSPERFNKVYRNIGASTKRDDNNQIGGFGIGKFAPLSYTNMVTITSNYEGQQYLYIIHKDGTNVNIDLITTIDTTEPNGVSITINLEQEADLPRFANSILSQLAYFENVYLIDALDANENNNLNLDYYNSSYKDRAKEIIRKFNNLKIKKFDNYAINSGLDGMSYSSDVILGRVKYPLDMSKLSFDVANLDPEVVKVWNEVQGDDFSALVHLNPPFSIICDIGELNITPNREQILYSTQTNRALSNKYVLALAEFIKRHENEVRGEHTDLREYVKDVLSERKFNLFPKVPEGEIQPYLMYKFNKEFGSTITLNGTKRHKHFVEIVDKFLGISTTNCSTSYVRDAYPVVGYLIAGTFTSNRIPRYHEFNYSQDFKWFAKNRKSVVVLDKPFSSLTQLEKHYFKSSIFEGRDLIFINKTYFKYKHMTDKFASNMLSIYVNSNRPSELRRIEDLNSDIYDSSFTISMKYSDKEKKRAKLKHKFYRKYAYEVLRYVLPYFKTLYLHNISSIPSYIKEEYNQVLKERRALKDKSNYNEILSLEVITTLSNKRNSGNYNTMVADTESRKIQDLVEKSEKGNIYIHFDKKENNAIQYIQGLAYHFRPMLERVTFIGVAPTKRKLLKDLSSNIISYEEMVKDSKIMRRLVTAMYISSKYPELSLIYEFNKNYIKEINIDMFNKLEVISQYFKYEDKKSMFEGFSGLNTFQIKQFKKEILEKGLKDGIIDLAVKNDFDSILSDLKKIISAIDLFRKYPATTHGSVTMTSVPIIVDFIFRNKIVKLPVYNVLQARLEVQKMLNSQS